MPDTNLPWIERYRRIEETALPESIPELLERAAHRYGDRMALNFFEKGNRISFADLRRAVRSLAHGFQLIGVRGGTHVAVLCSNRLEYPIIWLALAELGAVMVPLVSRSASRELEYFLGDADATFLVAEAALLRECGLTPGKGPVPAAERIVTLGSETGTVSYESLIASGDPSFTPAYKPAGSDLLNIQYTSGTTGLPKGTMLSHRYWIILGTAPSLVWDGWFGDLLAESPFYYMDAQWMVIASLHSGCRVDVAEKMSASKWLDRIHGCRTQVAWFSEQILKEPATEREKECAIKLFLAEHLSQEGLAAAEERFGAPVREAYGSTEAGFVLSVPLEIPDPAIRGTCGVEGPFRRCRVVLSDGTDAPPGVPGELWVSGDGMFAGYYKKPEANAEVLVDGWFRTGDLFVRDAKGYYTIVGRLKDVIRRSGENISSIEVEQALMDMPEVSRAAVVPVPDSLRGEEVKAYILPAGREKPGIEAILAHCRRRLASFKIPRYIAFVDALPYTASGKVAKTDLLRSTADLRIGTYDVVDRVQR